MMIEIEVSKKTFRYLQKVRAEFEEDNDKEHTMDEVIGSMIDILEEENE